MCIVTITFIASGKVQHHMFIPEMGGAQMLKMFFVGSLYFYSLSDVSCAQPVDEERAAFMRLAGDDGEIDAFELQEILNNEFKKREIFMA